MADRWNWLAFFSLCVCVCVCECVGISARAGRKCEVRSPSPCGSCYVTGSIRHCSVAVGQSGQPISRHKDGKILKRNANICWNKQCLKKGDYHELGKHQVARNSLPPPRPKYQLTCLYKRKKSSVCTGTHILYIYTRALYALTC